MGYKFQFITLAGFHSLNYGMFELARNYKDRGMAAYSELQQAEFEGEKNGYTAIRHQREVGTGYFDMVTLAVTGKTLLYSSLYLEAQTNLHYRMICEKIILGGKSSTTALSDSTEAAQFAEKPESISDDMPSNPCQTTIKRLEGDNFLR